MSALDRVLPQLAKAKRTAKGEWVACCPAHEDKHPSLTMRETDDGRLLLKCHAGCAASDIMAALGLSLADLYDQPLADRLPTIRHPYSPGAVLRAIRGELLIVAIAGHDAMNGKLTSTDRERMLLAIQRIEEAAKYA